MKRRILFALLTLLLPLSACAGQGAGQQSRVTIVATTYPVYLFATRVTQGVPGIEIERLGTGEASCLHDYTLSVTDMKLLERADVVVLNGLGLEEFMDDALATATAATVECAQGAWRLESGSHDHQEGASDDHDHGHWDPHIWMDPGNAQIMVFNLAQGLAGLDEDYSQTYLDNGQQAAAEIDSWAQSLHQQLSEARRGLDMPGLVTFHDGFGYFAQAFDLPLLASIEEEEGSEASAKEIVDITQLVKEYSLPVIFTEVNGSDATAQAIARETGCQVGQLSMMMDGPDSGLEAYFDILSGNVAAVVNGFAGDEVMKQP